MKHSSGGITLLFALIVTLFSLGVIFLLNYSLIIGLEVNRIDYINTQLFHILKNQKKGQQNFGVNIIMLILEIRMNID